MISLIIVIAIAVAIIGSYKTKINTGLFAIAFAYIIGSFIMKLNPASVIILWPISIFFVILSTTLFFNFAVENGTLEKIAEGLLYKCRKVPVLIPFAIFIVAALISMLGAGYYAAMVLLVPIALLVFKKVHIDTLDGAICCSLGAQAGGCFMVSQNGNIFRQLIESQGYNFNFAFEGSSLIFISYIIVGLAIVTLLTVLARKRQKKNIKANGQVNSETIDVVKKPDAFNKKQKINLFLILLMMLVVLCPPILHMAFSKVAIFTFINAKIDVGLVSIIFAIIAAAFNLADQKKVLAKVPWDILIMISGVGILVNLGVKAGVVKLLANWMGTNVPVFLVPIVFALIAAVINLFSSVIGVIAPAFFPVVPIVAHLTGLNPLVLFTCIVVGGFSSGVSPFSGGGAMVIGFCQGDKERSEMFSKELFHGVPFCTAIAVIICIIICVILR